MRKKLNCILLIDDSKPTNFIHKMVINETDCTEKIMGVDGGEAALAYLRSKEDGEYPRPDLIFLDINMPGMDGWEFLEEYAKLDELQKGGIVLFMLTTSLNPDDKTRADKIDIIKGFMNKPLTKESLNELLDSQFDS